MKTKHGLLFGTAAMILAAAFILTGCPDTSDDKEPEKVAAPIASLAAGGVPSGTEITLTTATAGADIYYTLNGSNPTASSAKYTAKIPITSAVIIKAIAIKAGMTDSDVLTAAYTILTPAPDIFAVDISQETDWNYMVVGKDGSSLFFNADESTGIPTLAYLKPDKDSDAGFTYLFKENGLPDKIIANGHILYFGNFNGYKFDMAIIYPNNAIEYHYDIETDINWDAYDEISPERSILGRAISNETIKQGWIAGITCIGAAFLPFLGGSCVTNALKFGTDIVIDLVIPADQVEDVKYARDTIFDVFKCAAKSWGSCISGLIGVVDIASNIDLSVINQKIEQIDEAIRRIEGDALQTTVIPHDLLEDLLELGIEVNHGNNPPNIEGTYFMSPSILVRSNFNDGYSPGYQFNDIQLIFSNQDNAKMTVDVGRIESDTTYSAINSFITGEGTKFSVFSETTGTDGSRSVNIYSGEITSSGIRNFSMALIMTVEGTNTINRGQGRLVYDSDRFSEKTSRSVYGQGRSVLPSAGLSLKDTASRH
jgi:hypothetical protein